ncbi:hypothetical protein ABK040_010148 [Willaertia magna]
MTETGKRVVDTFTRDEVAKHNKEEDGWVIVGGIVYNVTEFVDAHPGGIDILVDYLGRDITEIMQKPSVHKHSGAAYSMLEQYAIGKLDESSSNYEDIDTRKAWGKVDFTKPLVHQVGLLGKDYFHWVETDPVFFKEPVTLFQNSFIEMTTHTPWWVVPAVWLPTCLILNLISVYQGASLLTLLFSNILGFFIWFVLEYGIHKYIYHWDSIAKPGFYIGNILHFLLHGFHHKVPMDKDRLVAPIPLFMILSSPFVLLAVKLFPATMAYAAIAGGFLGYVYYDMHHYWLHHAANAVRAPEPFRSFFLTKRWQTLKTHHFIHHFAPGGELTNYGISNRIVDIVFGSLREKH